MIKPQIFLISTIGFLCYALGMNYVKPQGDPYPGSAASTTTKIAKYKDMESKFISQFTFNKYFKPWAGKAVYKGGQRVIGGVREKDGWYTELPLKISSIDHTLQSLRALAEALPDLPVTLSINPYKAAFMYEKFFMVKSFADFNQEVMGQFSEQLPANMQLIVPYMELKKNWQNYYYKTDHHFTLDGAILVFNAIMQSINLPPLDKKQLVLVPKNTSEGWIKMLYLDVKPSLEKTSITNFTTIKQYSVSYLKKDGTQFSFITNPYHQVSDLGSVSHPVGMGRYQNKQAPIDQHILIIGNSYSSFHMPLLFSSYFKTVDHVQFIDPENLFTRYNIANYVRANHIDHIFIIGGSPTWTFTNMIQLQQSLAITDSPPLPDAWVNMKE